MALSAITDWISQRPKWLQVATKGLLGRGQITAADLLEIVQR